MRDDRHDVIEESAPDSEDPAVTAGAAQEPAQHVAASLVGGHDAVRDEECRRACMVRDDPKGNVRLFIGFVSDSRLFADCSDDILNGIDLEHVVDALHDAGKPFEPHAGIDVFMRKLGVVAVTVVIELGEHVVPDLHIAVAVAAGTAVGTAAAVFFAAVEVDFGAGAAGALSVLPEVVLLAEAHDVVLAHADFIAPNAVCLLVFLIYGRPQQILRNFQHLRQKFPRPCERFFLKIIAEGEIAEHLKEGSVARGIADVLDVVRADALLAGRHSAAGRFKLSRKVFFERRHSRDDEQERFVVFRHKGIASAAEMSFGFKEIEKFLAQVVERCPFHDFSSF